MSSDTGPAVMTRQEAERLIAKAIEDLANATSKGGANVNVGVQDQRFTKVISWVWVAIGATAITVSAWGVNSIQELNLKVGVLISQHDRDSDDLKDLRERVHTLELRK